jgi:hypothetical protein
MVECAVEFSEFAVDPAAVSRVVAAQRLVLTLGGPASQAQRAALWQQMESLLEKQDSDAVTAAVSFGLRRVHDIPSRVLGRLSKRAETSASILFEESEGISEQQWRSLRASPLPALRRAISRRDSMAQRKESLAGAAPASDRLLPTLLGAGYPQLKASLGELHDRGHLTNRLMMDIIDIWGIQCVVGTLALRSALPEPEILQRMRLPARRAALFAACDFDASLVSAIRNALAVSGNAKTMVRQG